MPGALALIGWILLVAGAAVLILFRSWTRVLIALAVQSLGFGLLAAFIAPLPIAIAKAVVGWIAAALLAITLTRDYRELRGTDNALLPFLFRLSLLLLLFASILALLPRLLGLFHNPPLGIAFAAFFLLAGGLINIGLSEHPLRVGVSLLTMLQGFELGYLWLEQSLLVLALLAITDLAVILALIVLHAHAAPSAGDAAL